MRLHEDILIIDWPDAHLSKYSLDGLERTAAGIHPSGPVPDEQTVSSAVSRETTYGLLSDDGCLGRVLATLSRTGWVALGPPREGDGHPLASFDDLIMRIAGFLQPSYFGDYFDLTDRPLDDTDSISFSARALPLHTDLPYYSTPPDFQFLYGLDVDPDCAAQGIGQTRFVDGAAVVETLRKHHPLAFDILCSVPVTYRATYSRSGKIYESTTPIIRTLDRHKIQRIVNNPSKMFLDHIPPDQFHTFFQSYKVFRTLLANEARSYTHDWHTGDLVIWDNRRVFHGRDDFGASQRKRLLRGGYFSEIELSARHRYVSRAADLAPPAVPPTACDLSG